VFHARPTLPFEVLVASPALRSLIGMCLQGTFSPPDYDRFLGDSL